MPRGQNNLEIGARIKWRDAQRGMRTGTFARAGNHGMIIVQPDDSGMKCSIPREMIVECEK